MIVQCSSTYKRRHRRVGIGENNAHQRRMSREEQQQTKGPSFGAAEYEARMVDERGNNHSFLRRRPSSRQPCCMSRFAEGMFGNKRPRQCCTCRCNEGLLWQARVVLTDVSRSHTQESEYSSKSPRDNSPPLLPHAKPQGGIGGTYREGSEAQGPPKGSQPLVTVEMSRGKVRQPPGQERKTRKGKC